MLFRVRENATARAEEDFGGAARPKYEAEDSY